MYLTRLVFGSYGNDDGKGRLRIENHRLVMNLDAEKSRWDIATSYMMELNQNGQICGDYILAPCGGQIVAYANVMRPDALAKRHHSKSGQSALHEVVGAFGQTPQFEILQDCVPARWPSWKKSSSLFLYGDYFDSSSPIHCGDTGDGIPIYLLSLSEKTSANLDAWASDYREIDSIWMSSSSLEIPAYKQIADPRSELAEMGRTLCREIESATGKRAFYYLKRHWGRKNGEQDRPCPLCGRRWRTGDQESVSTPFWKFSFRCVRCRLVSECGNSSDERHAVIGEYPKRKAKAASPELP